MRAHRGRESLMTSRKPFCFLLPVISCLLFANHTPALDFFNRGFEVCSLFIILRSSLFGTTRSSQQDVSLCNPEFSFESGVYRDLVKAISFGDVP